VPVSVEQPEWVGQCADTPINRSRDDDVTVWLQYLRRFRERVLLHASWEVIDDVENGDYIEGRRPERQIAGVSTSARTRHVVDIDSQT